MLSFLAKLRQPTAVPAVALLLATLLAGPSLAPAAAQSAPPTLDLWDHDEPLSASSTGAGPTLSVGVALYAGLRGATPDAVFTFELLDEGGTLLSLERVVADSTGVTDRALLLDTVVGCDPGAPVDPTTLRFDTFEVAELGLAGRVVEVVVRDDTGSVVVDRQLPFDVTVRVPRVAAFDGTGCPRRWLEEGEAVYVGGYRIDDAQTMRVFVVPSQETWTEGDRLLEVRPAYVGAPQVVSVAAGGSFLDLAWTAAEEGTYDIVFRRSPPTTPVLDHDDAFGPRSGWGHTGAGLSIGPCWDCPAVTEPDPRTDPDPEPEPEDPNGDPQPAG